jgi:hypothetical protein
MTEIILVITVSVLSIGMFVFAGFQINKFLKYFIPIIKEINEQNKNQQM